MLRRIDRLAWVDSEERNATLARAAQLEFTNPEAARLVIEAFERSCSVRTWYIDLSTATHVWTGRTAAGRIFYEKLSPKDRELFRDLLANPSAPYPQERALYAALLEQEVQQLFIWRSTDGRYAQEHGFVPGGARNQWGEVNRDCIPLIEQSLAPDDLRRLRTAAPDLFAQACGNEEVPDEDEPN